MTIEMDMIQTTGLAVILLLFGGAIRKKYNIFVKYCIPAPVIGGLFFSIIAWVLRATNVAFFEFDETLRIFFQTMYFCTIGFDASFKMLKIGGKKVVIFLGIAIVFALSQNVLAIGLSKLVGIDPLLALITASPALTGGLGTSAAVAPSIEALGYPQAMTVGLTAATIGMVAGSIMGGPVATKLIKKYNLFNKREEKKINYDNIDLSVIETKEKILNTNTVSMAIFIILICMGIGTYITSFINNFVGQYIEGVSFPAYIGAMLVAAVFRNLSDSKILPKTPVEEVTVVGDAARNVFLGIALMTLQLWQAVQLATPMFILLACQIIMAYLFAKYICFPLMGKNYDAAMISAGLIGFGMGSTSNAMANMDAVSQEYEYSKLPYFVVPIVGTLFIDFINIGIIYAFIGGLQ